MPTYSPKKNMDTPKPPKHSRQKFLTAVQFKQLQQSIIDHKSKYMHRDHCAIFMGYHFGLRIGEARLLDRETFRHIEESIAHIKTLKQTEKIPVQCKHCGKKVRVAMSKSGSEHTCVRCGHLTAIPRTTALRKALPEVDPPVVETHVIQYAKNYMENIMRPDQTYFFEGRDGKPISISQLKNIFNSYVMRSGLDHLISWHALRHGRGVLIWDKFQNPVLTRDMLRQKSLASTERYLHLSPKRQDEARKALDEDSEKSGVSHNPFG